MSLRNWSRQKFIILNICCLPTFQVDLELIQELDSEISQEVISVSLILSNHHRLPLLYQTAAAAYAMLVCSYRLNARHSRP